MPAVNTKSPKRKGNRPPSGKVTASPAIGAAAPSATTRPRRLTGRTASAYAVDATARKTPATGLDSGVATASTTAERPQPAASAAAASLPPARPQPSSVAPTPRRGTPASYDGGVAPEPLAGAIGDRRQAAAGIRSASTNSASANSSSGAGLPGRPMRAMAAAATMITAPRII